MDKNRIQEEESDELVSEMVVQQLLSNRTVGIDNSVWSQLHFMGRWNVDIETKMY